MWVRRTLQSALLALHWLSKVVPSSSQAVYFVTQDVALATVLNDTRHPEYWVRQAASSASPPAGMLVFSSVNFSQHILAKQVE
jgi:hypothetical protein